MNRLYVFLTAFALVLYFGTPAFAQHGRGSGGGGGRGSGGGGMSSMPSGQGRGPSGSEMRAPHEQGSKEKMSKESGSAAGKKTTSELLTQNTKLSSKLQGIVPAGTNLQDAAQGFDHLGDFVAATHASHNLGIPFDQMKTQMMSGDSLGQTIHKLRPDVDARQEAIKANEQAIDDMEQSFGRGKSEARGQR